MDLQPATSDITIFFTRISIYSSLSRSIFFCFKSTSMIKMTFAQYKIFIMCRRDQLCSLLATECCPHKYTNIYHLYNNSYTKKNRNYTQKHLKKLNEQEWLLTKRKKPTNKSRLTTPSKFIKITTQLACFLRYLNIYCGQVHKRGRVCNLLQQLDQQNIQNHWYKQNCLICG